MASRCSPATTDAGKQAHHDATRAAGSATQSRPETPWRPDADVAARSVRAAWWKRTERDDRDRGQQAVAVAVADSTVADNAAVGDAEADGRATDNTATDNVLVMTPWRSALEWLSWRPGRTPP